jgi:hypothetical protein
VLKIKKTLNHVKDKLSQLLTLYRLLRIMQITCKFNSFGRGFLVNALLLCGKAIVQENQVPLIRPKCERSTTYNIRFHRELN